MKHLLFTVLFLTMFGCGISAELQTQNLCDEIATPKKEAFVLNCINGVKVSSLSGHDQDWDDLVSQCATEGTRLYCTPQKIIRFHSWDNYLGEKPCYAKDLSEFEKLMCSHEVGFKKTVLDE